MESVKSRETEREEKAQKSDINARLAKMVISGIYIGVGVCFIIVQQMIED